MYNVKQKNQALVTIVSKWESNFKSKLTYTSHLFLVTDTRTFSE